MPPPYRNIHGRQGTRGLRPWLLIPKILGVALFLGGLVAVWALLIPPATPRGVVRIYYWMILPGMALSSIFGVLLWLQHPGVFLRQRWFQVKMALILAVLPGMHMMCLYVAWLGRMDWLRWLLGPVFVISLLIMALGRQKPRLGQNWGKDFPKR